MDNYEEYYYAGELIVKYLRGELSAPELDALNNWRKSSAANERLFARLTSEKYLLGELPEFSERSKSSALKNVLDNALTAEKPTLTFKYHRFFKYAASVAFFAVIGYTLMTFYPGAEPAPISASLELMPGGERAVLRLEGGREIDLDKAGTGEIARQGYAIISKSEEGHISYSIDATEAIAGDDASAFNTISTPRGGQYQLRLPDGSKVWLNAYSSLKFPTRFNKNERRVELSGEAYFEVVHFESNPLPFRVVSGSQVVEVLGTEFNVNGYSDEGNITTTLLNGKVRVGLKDGGRSATPEVTLLPGQKASVGDQSGKIEVSEADVEESVAWKNGKFQFNDTDLATIMRQISRWYDVEVEFRDGLQDLRFRGSASRDVPASHLFEILKASGINIKTEGRKIIVSN